MESVIAYFPSFYDDKIAISFSINKLLERMFKKN